MFPLFPSGKQYILATRRLQAAARFDSPLFKRIKSLFLDIPAIVSTMVAPNYKTHGSVQSEPSKCAAETPSGSTARAEKLQN